MGRTSGRVEVPPLDTIRAWTEVWHKKLWRRLRHIPDDAVEAAHQASDVANVREGAWSVEHQQEMLSSSSATACGAQSLAPELLVDSVAVFERSAVGLQTSIIENTQQLLQGRLAKRERESESDDDSEEENRRCAAPEEGHTVERKHRFYSKREKAPMNEYTANHRYLYDAFWNLFPLQTGLPSKSVLTTPDARHLLTQFHNAFAENSNFVFLLANQIQRAAVARGQEPFE